MFTNDLRQKLQEIGELKAGWNGYDSQPIGEDVITNTEIIVNSIPFSISLFPTGRNSIQLECFKNADQDGVEIEVFNDCTSTSIIKRGEYLLEDNVGTNEDAVANLLSFYYQ